jgi:hypothetical protein
MIFLMCPQCENAMLETREHGRKCPECQFYMTEPEFQVHHAKQVEIEVQVMNSVTSSNHRSFGKKPNAS